MSSEAHMPPSGSASGAGQGTRDQSKEVARIAAFSDGVFAIAITILALQLEISRDPGVDVWHELVDIRWRFLAFAISFAVIGAYWVAHHRLFSMVDRYDMRLIWLNLLVLFFIVLIPFTTSLVGEHGSSRVSVAIYALSIAAAGFSSTGMAVYVFRDRRLSVPGVSERVVKYHVWRGLVIALVFVASLALLPLGPGMTQLSWLALIPLEQVVRRRFGGHDED